jgi:hypothetical protein
MNKCLTCGKDVKNKYCNVSCQNRDQNTNRFLKRKLGLYGEIKEFQVFCNKCNKSFIVKEREKLYPKKQKYFCSRYCANSKIQTSDINLKRSNTLREYWINQYKLFPDKYVELNGKISKTDSQEEFYKKLYNGILIRNCPKCSIPLKYTTFVSLHRSTFNNSICKKCRKQIQLENGHFTKMGQNSARTQSQNRRSKNEIAFADLCKTRFNGVLTNNQMFNGWDADVILPNEKIAILWNGKWHYEKLTNNHSVIQVQNRDKIKLDEITKFGYIPYVIKDMGKFNMKFVNEEFKKFMEFTKTIDISYK